MSDVDKKKVIVIAPAQESIELYRTQLEPYETESMTFNYYHSFDDFSIEMSKFHNYAGFIVDLRCIIKAGEGDKEFFYYLIETFPVIRISHSKDGQMITGNIRGKTLNNRDLFEFFFKDVCKSETTDGRKRIVLFVQDEKSQELYKNWLNQYPGFAIEWFRSAAQLQYTISQNKHYCGFIIDLRTMMKSTSEDKDFFYELLESFPSMRISHTLDNKTIKGNIRDKSFQDKELFDNFFENCRYFEPRGLRTKERQNLFLSVLVTGPMATGEILSEPIKANTINVSENGFFLTSPLEFKRGAILDVSVHDFADKTPLKCTVKWTQSWGSSIRHLPGSGVSIIALTPAQQVELMELMA